MRVFFALLLSMLLTVAEEFFFSQTIKLSLKDL